MAHPVPRNWKQMVKDYIDKLPDDIQAVKINRYPEYQLKDVGESYDHIKIAEIIDVEIII